MPVVTRPPAAAHGGDDDRQPAAEGAAEFFELLLRDAAAIEFERPLVRARSAGAGPKELAELERTKLLALQVRAAFEARRRRESELSALFDTASDLAALRGVDSVLTAIVRRARQLLGTDVSYLTLNDDERGDTYMRVTDGSVSARFQSLRLPMGAGLGGLVAQTSAPYATASYFTDPRFRHTSEINDGVRDEGLLAILGVPLVRGSRVIGVLFAADRTERTFDRSEVSLLCSLAAHAAIALDNARLLEETRTALDELSAATRELRAHTASVEQAAAAHDRFIDIVLGGGGFEDVAAAVAETLGGQITTLDEEGRLTPAQAGEDAALPPDPAGALTLARTTGRTVRDGTTWTAAVTVGNELLGGLVLHREKDLSDAEQRILERAALVTALLLLIRRTAGEAENRVRGELLEELLTSPSRDADGLRERARWLGSDLDRPTAVAVARTGERGARAGPRCCSSSGRHPRWPGRAARRQRGGLPAGSLARRGRRHPPPGSDRCGSRSGHRGRCGPRPRPGRDRRGARRGRPVRRDAGRARARRDLRRGSRAGVLRAAAGREPRRRRVRRGDTRAGARLRRPSRHRPDHDPASVLRQRRIPRPGRGGPARARQHGHPAAGPGGAAAGQGLVGPRPRARGAAGPAAARPDRLARRPTGASYPGRVTSTQGLAAAPGPASSPEAVLTADRWLRSSAAHASRADALTAAHRARRATGERHPVEDFLYEYYNTRPSLLRRWHPGAGVALRPSPEGAAPHAAWRWYRADDDGVVRLDGGRFLADRADTVAFIRGLLAATASRPAFTGCFGLHEWAMVYREDERRHPLPLRLGRAGTDAVVESSPIRCSHFDAFRFFTPDAVPLNRLQPTRATQAALEQPGCLHATMDLYKWAGKLGPAVPGDLLLDCFELAADVRTLDMRASPYDLRGHGYEPVAVETPEGKAEYVSAQRAFAERGTALRGRLLDVCDRLLPAG